MRDASTTELLQLDQRYLWHPYSQVDSDSPIYPVKSAKGAHLHLSDGTTLLDGMSSWWCTIHGYNHPELNKALIKQTQAMAHVMFGGLTHEPAITLGKTLIDLSPDRLKRVFICDSGSVSVEVAMKMALQYCRAKNQTRSKFLSFKKAYHGDTFGAMSVCDPVTGMHSLFSDVLHQNIFCDAPSCKFNSQWQDSYFENFLQVANENKNDIAAVILEPIVQGAGGMNFYSPHFLKALRDWCDENKVLFIADEIATGFGRTGKLFACEHADISPDILCLGKSLTGGYMSLAATLCSEDVAQTICQGEAGVFMHGPTFMANPLACSVANKSIELLLKSDWQTKVLRIEKLLRDGLASCQELEGVVDVRCLGAIGVIELNQPVDMKLIQPMFVEEGIWIRPFGKLIYTMPAFICNDQEIEFLCNKMVRVVEKYLRCL